MAQRHFMTEIAWPDFEARITAKAPVLLPLGATEQHGPHLPLSVDVILPNAICEGVAERIDGLVAPPVFYGYKSQPRSGGGQGFPGTTSLSAQTFSLLVRDIILDLARHGVKRLALVNGHYENIWPAIEGIDLALTVLRCEGISDLAVIRADIWEFTRRTTLDRLFPEGFPGTELEHASLLETSLMLHIRPDLVDLSKIPSDGPAKFPCYDRYPIRPGLVPVSGVLACARGSSAEKGRWLFEDHVTLLTEALIQEFDLECEADHDRHTAEFPVAVPERADGPDPRRRRPAARKSRYSAL